MIIIMILFCCYNFSHFFLYSKFESLKHRFSCRAGGQWWPAIAAAGGSCTFSTQTVCYEQLLHNVCYTAQQLRCYHTGEDAIARKHSGNGQFSRQNWQTSTMPELLHSTEPILLNHLFWSTGVFAVLRPAIKPNGQTDDSSV